ncbi:MAG: alpha/beta fold hydrolase [Verrucomicrobiales bacterium]
MIENLIPYQSETGKKLAMREFLPETEGRPRAGIIILHGLGDYVLCYREAAEVFTEMGIAVIGIDLPGHGESEGKRGLVGSLTEVHAIIDEARAALREIVEPIGGKIGALAHSTGGLLLFDYLTRFPGHLSFAWVNACLVDPLEKRSPRAATMAKIGKLIIPGHTISTKVVPSMGRDGAPDHHASPDGDRGHDRVSIGFAVELIRARDRVAKYYANLNRDFKLLMTHGTRDEVCPIGLAREFYSSLQIRKKEFREYPDHLHQLLHDPAVMDYGRGWLSRVLEPARIISWR